MDNPEGCFGRSIPDQLYTSYHGYFPTSYTEVEERHGTLEDLKEMVAAAHSKGIRVIADLVLNHVHDTHPLYEERSRREVSSRPACADSNAIGTKKRWSVGLSRISPIWITEFRSRRRGDRCGGKLALLGGFLMATESTL